MSDNKKEEEIKKETSSVLESEGIVIESVSLKEELEQDLNTPQTKEAEKELFEAVGVEIPEKIPEETEPTTDALKKELGSGGIEVLPTEPLGDEDL